jgi:hypothetical protein
MWIFLVVLSVLAVWAVVAAVVVALRDGYRPIPTCDFEGKRNPG